MSLNIYDKIDPNSGLPSMIFENTYLSLSPMDKRKYRIRQNSRTAYNAPVAVVDNDPNSGSFWEDAVQPDPKEVSPYYEPEPEPAHSFGGFGDGDSGGGGASSSWDDSSSNSDYSSSDSSSYDSSSDSSSSDF